MLHKGRAQQKLTQEENWGLLGEHLEMEGLAEGNCKAKGKLRHRSDGFSRRSKAAGLGGQAAMGTSSWGVACCCLCHPHLVEQAPISNPHANKGLCQGNPCCSFIAGSRLPWPQGLQITQSKVITIQKIPDAFQLLSPGELEPSPLLCLQDLGCQLLSSFHPRGSIQHSKCSGRRKGALSSSVQGMDTAQGSVAL